MSIRPLTLTLALVGLAPPALVAQEPDPGKAPSNFVVRTALEWMESGDPERRQAAYRSVHLLGKEALPAFRKALRAAHLAHQKRLTKILTDHRQRDNPYPELTTAMEELGTERERVLELIRTDWQKDPGKIRMLRTEFESVESLYDRATRLAAVNTTSVDAEIDSIATALVEIQDEIARFDPTPDDPDPGPITPDRKQEALRDSFDGETYLKTVQGRELLRAEVQGLDSANRDNAACTWADPAQQQFAAQLNRQRAVMGLDPLRLEEKLSAAATGHSEDMKRLGFFSHTSPVEGKHSPSDRARKAGFTGGWSGENIFAGSASPIAAYNAWFASDGHRFIMFAGGPNVIGVGPVGSHWTLMTGRK